MKYTFIDESGLTQCVNIPDEYIKTNTRNLGISTKEVIYMYLSDEGIVSDDTVKELSAKAKPAGKRKAPTRKPDEIKRGVIAVLKQCIQNMDNTADVSVTNVERVIAFNIGADSFEVVLQKKRKPKA